MVPIENSLEGSVNQTYDLFLQYDLKVCGEVIVKIDHCLIANPSTSLMAVKAIYSHPQALAQCRNLSGTARSRTHPHIRHSRQRKNAQRKRTQKRRRRSQRKSSRTLRNENPRQRHSRQPHQTTRGFSFYPKQDSPITGKDKTSIIFSATHAPGSLLQRPRRIRQKKNKPHKNRVTTHKTNTLGIQLLPRL